MSGIATPRRIQTLGGGGDAARAERGPRRDPLLLPDPFARIMHLGDRAVRIGLTIGITIGLGTHGVASARALSSLTALERATTDERAVLHEFFWRTYDIEELKKILPKAPEKETPPEPPPEPDPPPKAAAPAKPADPYDPPPTPAKAGKVLTQAPSADDKVEDMTNTIVSGDGAGTHGLVSANGVGDKATYNSHAALGGKPGGTGTGQPQAAPPPGPDLSKPPGLLGSGGNWACPFPPEADGESVDRADVVIRVTVRPDGSPAGVAVVSDPGHGFGRAARQCALGRRYSAGLDRTGQPITQSTPTITVHFTR